MGSGEGGGPGNEERVQEGGGGDGGKCRKETSDFSIVYSSQGE